jgi:hypothetical protein
MFQQAMSTFCRIFMEPMAHLGVMVNIFIGISCYIDDENCSKNP